MTKPNNGGALWGLISLCILAVAFVLGIVLSNHGADSGSTPIVTTVLGFLSLGIIALIGQLNAGKAVKNNERVEQKLDENTRETQALTNGKLKDAIVEALDEQTASVPLTAQHYERLRRVEEMLKALTKPPTDKP